MLPSFGEQTLNISEADTESVVEPDGMTDDFAWIAVSVIAGSGGFCEPTRQLSAQVDNAELFV